MNPTGNVTFLFTDIEGSTKLAQEFPVSLPAAIEKHHAILNEVIESNNGFKFEIVGDAFCCAYENAVDAVKAAVEIQNNLANEKWDDAVIKVRIGIHSGKAEWNGSRYMGYITLARTSRIMSAAYGEQILISNDAYELCKDKICLSKLGLGKEFKDNFEDVNGKDISFRDLGERRLKDVIQPIRLFQVLSKDLREDFPPLKTLDARPNNLPVQLTSFIGRESEILKIKKLLNQSRLLTLTGSGGAGKTRLALQVSADIIDDFENGVWLIELASISDPEILPTEFLKIFQLKEEPDKNSEDTLCDYLLDKEMLIIFDNCEHIVEACAKLALNILSNCPKIKLIATSREALRCDGEHAHRISSLDIPDPKVKNSPEKLSQFEGVRLFIERALSVNSGFRVNNENAPSLAEICYQLDGIPLAIELAAARAKILPVEKICERLSSRFKLLTGGKRTSLPRQQTLKALIDWSYDLLSVEEKILWNRLSVFSGGWTLDAAEEICSDDIIDKSEVFEILNSLSEKSIVLYNNEKERFMILETIRQYASDKINETNEYEKFSDKHFKFYLALAEAGKEKLRGIESGTITKIFESETGNLEKGLKWSAESLLNEDGLRLSAAMGRYWQNLGYITEGIHWIKTVLQKNTETNNTLYCIAICQLGNFERLKGNVDKARELIVESLRIRRELGDKAGTADSLTRLGILEYDQGRYDESAVLYEESMEIHRESGNKLAYAIVLNNLANVLSNQGKYSRAYELYEESLATRRESGDVFGIAVSLNNLGILAFELGEYQKAKELLQESLKLRHQTGNKEGIAISLMNLGLLSYNQGEYSEASKLYKESLDISIEIDEKSGIAESLYNLGKNSLEQNDLEKAFELLNESLEIGRVIKANTLIADSLFSLGRVAFEKKEYEQAKKLYRESLELYNETGNRKDIVLNILRFAQIYVREGINVLSLQILGFINREYLELKKIKLPLTDQIIYDKLLNGLKEKLTAEEFSEYFEKGESLTPEEVCKLILDF